MLQIWLIIVTLYTVGMVFTALCICVGLCVSDNRELRNWPLGDKIGFILLVSGLLVVWPMLWCMEKTNG